MRETDSDAVGSRRSLLKAAGTSVGAATLAGQASASNDASESALDYHAERKLLDGRANEQSARNVVESVGTGLLKELSARNLIDEPSFESLDFETVLSYEGERSRETLSVQAVDHPVVEKEIVYTTLLESEDFDSDIIVTFQAEHGAAAATAYRDGQRFVLTAEYGEFLDTSSEEYTATSSCSTCSPNCVNCPKGRHKGQYTSDDGSTSYCGSCWLWCNNCNDGGW